LHFDGADASTTFTDQKGNAWAATGNAQLDTAQFKFGTASLLLDGTNDDITTPDADKWTLAGDDFTIECWVRLNAIGAQMDFVSHYSSTSNQRGWIFGIDASDQLHFIYSTTGASGTTIIAAGAWGPSTGVWYHVAVTRNGADLKLFVNGTQVGSTHNIGVSSIFNSTAACIIGQRADGAGDLNGWIDEMRITRGVARYTANFTAPTAAFPDGGIA
jgi:hypothetical protein